MSSDFVMDILYGVLQEELDKFRADGLSDSEIVDKISELRIENALEKVTEAMASDAVDTMKNTMYERVIEEQSKAEQFMEHNREIWGNGFVASETMYLIALEAGSDIKAYTRTLPEEQYRDKMYRYYVLGELYGRACQQYLEIIYLVKGGFADGAYARWRSLYELSVISEFIKKNSEKVAKAYVDNLDGERGYPNWTKTSPGIAKKLKKENRENVNFSDIKSKCSMATKAWNNQYKLANKVVHATPQGTFDRLGVPSGPRDFTPVGHSDYGLAPPAVNAALSLSSIAADYFGLVRSGAAIVYTRVLTKWANLVRECYTDIEEKCFDEQEGSASQKNQ